MHRAAITLFGRDLMLYDFDERGMCEFLTRLMIKTIVDFWRWAELADMLFLAMICEALSEECHPDSTLFDAPFMLMDSFPC